MKVSSKRLKLARNLVLKKNYEISEAVEILKQTATAKFAAALDRIQPFLHNWQTVGGTWRMHNISRSQVIKRNAPVKEGTPELWDFMLTEIDNCVAKGYLKNS